MDEAWDFIKWLVGDTYKFEDMSCTSKLSFVDPCAFHARSYYEEHFVEPCAPPLQVLDYTPLSCDSCQSYEYDTNFCPPVIAVAYRLEHLDHEMNNSREYMENMIRTFMDQFSGLVRDDVESTMPISHEIDLTIGPTLPKSCLLGDCESLYPFIP